MIRSLRNAVVVGLAAVAGIGGALVAVGPAGATVNGHCGDVIVGSLHTGQNLRQGGLEAPDLHTYTERVNHALAPSVAVDFRSVGLYNQPSDLPNPRPILTSGTVVNSYLVHSDPVGHPPTELRLVGVRRSPEVIAARIADRYRMQLADGFLDEVRGLDAGPPLSRTASQALGYRELLAHLHEPSGDDPDRALSAAVEQAIGRTRGFARRQRSWFGRDPRISWLDSDEPGSDPTGDLAAMADQLWPRG